NMPAALVRNFSKNRINWLQFIPTITQSNLLALEIGPGTGGVSRQLSEYYNVVALERSAENCAFLNQCADESDLPILSVKKSDPPIPFADEQFDLVVLVGSLEWLGYCSDQPASLVVHRYLEEVYRVLKPGGSLYISSENASYIGYYFGIKEAHSLLRFISLLNPADADDISNHYTGQNFKNPTFSPSDLDLDLQKIGFQPGRAFWLHPDYSTPAYMIPLDAPDKILEYFIEQRLNPWDFQGERSSIYRFYCLLNKKLMKNFIEHYGLITSK
ncbi:class I SAM-dependent methyltransferase, partial [Litoricolaceae bacterium]|nr:class I SAM-dependent methyltransferase [Litorivicinaceae bacterium]